MCVNWCNLFLGEALINRSVATSVDSFVGNFGYGFWVSNLQITWTPFIRPAAVRLKTVSGKKDTGRVRFFGLRRNFQKLFTVIDVSALVFGQPRKVDSIVFPL